MSGLMTRLCAAALTALTLTATPAYAAGFKVGEQVPDFTLPAQNGEQVTMSDYTDGLVVLEWYNIGCPFVQKHYKSHNMQDLQKKYTDQDVTWLRVISSAPGKQGHMTQAQAQEDHAHTHATYTLLDEDGKVGKLYGAKATPHMYVINQGKLVYRGAIDSIPSARLSDIPKATNYIDAALQATMVGEGVEAPETQAYGCGVKYAD